jgi:hypothetical protein
MIGPSEHTAGGMVRPPQNATDNNMTRVNRGRGRGRALGSGMGMHAKTVGEEEETNDED